MNIEQKIRKKLYFYPQSFNFQLCGVREFENLIELVKRANLIAQNDS